MLLELKYKQGDTYCIIYNNQSLTVTKEKLIDIIKNTPAPQRNCKVCANCTISMKSGYGKLPIKRLSKDYVEVILNLLPQDTKNYIHWTTAEFDTLGLAVFKKYFSIMKQLEGIDVLDLEYGTIKNMFGVTNYRDLSSGMKCILVAMLYADKNQKKIINVSSASGDYLNVLCKNIINSDIKLVINHKDLVDIEVPLKWNNKIYEDGSDLLCGVYSEWK